MPSPHGRGTAKGLTGLRVERHLHVHVKDGLDQLARFRNSLITRRSRLFKKHQQVGVVHREVQVVTVTTVRP